MSKILENSKFATLDIHSTIFFVQKWLFWYVILKQAKEFRGYLATLSRVCIIVLGTWVVMSSLRDVKSAFKILKFLRLEVSKFLNKYARFENIIIKICATWKLQNCKWASFIGYITHVIMLCILKNNFFKWCGLFRHHFF